jgi:lysophospholipase L1-like esterase
MKADDEMIIEKNFEPHGSLPLRKRSMFKVISRGLNDMAGILLTVNRRAIERGKKLLKEIVTLCKERDIHLIIIGPASRPRSKVENYLLNRLEVKLASEFKNEIQNYITCFGKRGSNNENLFLEDGVHVSKEGHKRIADFITPVMLKFI